MQPIVRTLCSTALLFAFGLAPGCSRSPEAAAPSPANEAEPPPPATPAPPATAAAAPGRGDALTAEQDAEPTTLADAEALLEKARAQLDQLALNDVRSAPAPAAAAPAPQPEARRTEKSSASQKAEAEQAKPANPCETACKAFSSLTRASDAVCRLDAGDGKRCERARRIHEDASQRVASCGCAK